MEKFEQRRELGLSKVVGATPEEEKKILERFKEIFENQPIESVEIEKSPEELEIIETVLEKMREFVERYDGVSVSLKPEHIHILDIEKMDEEERKKREEEGGFYAPSPQFIGIFSDESKLKEAQRIVHEILHFNSFLSVVKFDTEKYEGLHLRRQGSKIFAKTGKEFYFRDIDEAIITELTMRFDEQYFGSIPALSEEIKRREECRAGILERDSTATDLVRNISLERTRRLETDEYETVIEEYGYTKERDKLNKLIKDIYQNNQDSFSSEEEVFNMLARVVFTGRLLDVARLIEKIYGKGSFRKIAEESKEGTKEE